VSIQFLLTTFLVVASPGIGVLFTMKAGLSRGVRAGVIAAFGCTLGIVPHMAAAVTGLGAVLDASPRAFEILKYAGVTYLLYMAWNTVRDRGALSVEGEDAENPPPAHKVIIAGILANLLNPKLTIFFLAFLPQFVDPDSSNSFLRMVALSGVFMGLTFITFIGYGAFAAAIRSKVLARPRVMDWMRRIFAGGFVALALRLGFGD
jgi:threonine/homoserine/homoserine lactone efflux protein